VAATGDDEDNLVVSLLAKQEFAVARVVARVYHPKNQWLFNEQWGVDVSVSTPHLLTALVDEAVSAVVAGEICFGGRCPPGVVWGRRPSSTRRARQSRTSGASVSPSSDDAARFHARVRRLFAAPTTEASLPQRATGPGRGHRLGGSADRMARDATPGNI
jgi:TrkA-N domain